MMGGIVARTGSTTRVVAFESAHCFRRRRPFRKKDNDGERDEDRRSGIKEKIARWGLHLPLASLLIIAPASCRISPKIAEALALVREVLLRSCVGQGQPRHRIWPLSAEALKPALIRVATAQRIPQRLPILISQGSETVIRI